MDSLKCFKCAKEFSCVKSIIQHLKLDHFYRDHSTQFKCVVKGTHCDAVFLTYGGLQKHIKKCMTTQKESNEQNENVDEINELVNDFEKSVGFVDTVRNAVLLLIFLC